MSDQVNPPGDDACPSRLPRAGLEGSGPTLAARLSPAGPESNTPVQHGNAFSMMRARGDTSRLPRKRDGNTPPATLGEASKPGMVRRATGLNYDEELAIPMPKPPSRRQTPVDETVLAEVTSQTRARLVKKRSMPEPRHGKVTPSPVNPADGKKKSRLEAIKSKLSFRDLRKEAERSESARLPLPTRLMVYSPTLVRLTPLSEAERMSCAAEDAAAPLGPAQNKPAPSRIPFAPSGTYTHAQGSMTSTKSPAGQEDVESVGQLKDAGERAETHGSLKPRSQAIPVPAAKQKTGPATATHVDSEGQTPAAAERVRPQQKPETTTKAIPVPLSRCRPGPPLVTRLSFEASTRRRSPLVPESAESDYPPTGHSPPKLSDLTEGSGKVKYLPKHWLEKSPSSTPTPTARSTRHRSALSPSSRLPPTMESPSDPLMPSTPSPSSTIRSIHEGSPLSRERAPSAASMYVTMPGFEERLAHMSPPLGYPAMLESEPPGLLEYRQELIDKILDVQRQADAEIRDLTQKVVDLSKWMHGQLANHEERVGDLEGTMKELLTQQVHMQRDLVKLKQDFDIKVNVANQRVDNLETKVRNDLEAEMQKLAVSVQKMTQKIEQAIEKSADHLCEAPLLMEKHQERLDKMAMEIAELHQKHEDQYNTLPSGFGRTQRFVSETPFAIATPVLEQPEPPIPPMRVSPMPRSVTVNPTPQREPASAESKTITGFRRSASVKKGLAKVTSIPPGSQGKSQKVDSGDEPKGWKLFGFRPRRDAPSDGSTTAASKFPWRPRPGQAPDNASSRSESPPPPAVPRHVQTNIENNIRAASQVHPARRNRIQQTVMQDESLRSPTSPYHTAALPARAVTQLPRPNSQVINGITISVAPSSASSRERQGAGGEMLSPSRYIAPADPFDPSPTTAGSNPSFEHMCNPFGEEEESHDGDQCSESLHEAKS